MDSIRFIEALKSLVSYHRVCGIREYRGGDRLRDALRVVATAPAESRQPPRSADVSLPGTAVPAAAVTPATGQERSASMGLTDLAAHIAICRLCDLHLGRRVDTAGRGGERPKLLIVGDWLTLPDDVAPKRGVILGAEQDLMLSRMITAIDLGEEDVFVTNAIKCSLPAACRPTPEQVSVCSNYLQRQIDLLAPRIICSMGTVASQLLTGRSQPLSRLRGRFFAYRTAAGTEIPLMPTYHPGFLMRNPEMKQATWSDLQAIRKKLGEGRPS